MLNMGFREDIDTILEGFQRDNSAVFCYAAIKRN